MLMTLFFYKPSAGIWLGIEDYLKELLQRTVEKLRGFTFCSSWSTFSLLLKSWWFYWLFKQTLVQFLFFCEVNLWVLRLIGPTCYLFLTMMIYCLWITLLSVFIYWTVWIMVHWDLTKTMDFLHCTLYSKVNWTATKTHSLGHWYVFICIAVIAKFPSTSPLF